MEIAADLYRHYAKLHANGSHHEGPNAVRCVTGYRETCAILRDPRFGREGLFQSIIAQAGDAKAAALPMRFQDPPDYIRLRNIVGHAFHSLVEGSRPRIRQIVDGLVDAARNAGGMDVVADFGLMLSVRVILELLGVPAADHAWFRRWSRDMTQSLDPAADAHTVARGMAAQHAVDDYFRAFIAEPRRSAGDDVVSRLTAAKADGDALNESELVDICGFLFLAGHVTSVDLIANGMLSLLVNPSELRRLHERPELLPAALEELLRYESPVQRVGRMSYADVEIGGMQIPQGSVVIAMLGAANRDPAQFVQPERLDLTRRHNRHIAFGSGPRTCLGASLARLEGQIAIGTLLRRLPKLALADDVRRWRNSTETRGLSELRVTF